MTFQYFASRTIRLAFVLAAMILAAGGCSSDDVATSPDAQGCANLAATRFTDTTVQQTQFVAAGADLQPITGSAGKAAAAFCRVVATVGSEPGEHVGIEVWLPASNWNGRLLGTGSGGFGGAIVYGGLMSAIANGYAAANTDTGHLGGASGAIGQVLGWAVDPVQLRDWGRTSVHLMTVSAKAIVHAFYGQGAQHAYFEGCSTGGNEAMAEAEFYPDDYDGIHAGSPGMGYSHLMESFLWGGLLPSTQPEATLTPAAMALLNDAVLNQCGGSQAAGDGFLANPLACSFDVTRLQCAAGQDPARCLSAAQVRQAQRLYSPVRNTVDGSEIYPGFAFGSERHWASIQGALIGAYAQPLLANTVFGDPNWDWTRFDFGQDAARVDAMLTPKINSTNPDLSAFAARGGKLIMTQGWVDSLNAQTLPIEYFEQVAARQGGIDATTPFFRVVMVPGMDHCGGGPGANTIGGAVPPLRGDASRDVVAGLRAWVEGGVAPDGFVATKYVDDNPASGVAFERPVCVYPAYPRYRGTGDRNAAASYQCVAGPRLQ
ncbi:tannase/feruloyl esterase family alpha/beta hydrolase [Burkholderia gladioli]|uniref:tannase/feruloyl esterase family alpha/beta hydrolase n=1 Tax=Burkholderia gladioli TaxID=28095 RepID=UPI001641DF12|nr:tannase/feruloyl esterase family alpha/beta hydrolase [Burkholderia gladioli]